MKYPNYPQNENTPTEPPHPDTAAFEHYPPAADATEHLDRTPIPDEVPHTTDHVVAEPTMGEPIPADTSVDTPLPETTVPTEAPTEPHDTTLVPATPSTEVEKKPKGKQPKPRKPKVRGSLAGGTWVALIVGALLLILLLVFILQNQQQTELHLFTWSFSFPAGVGFLLAAITGALIMALVGGVRMLELRRQVKKEAKRLQN